MNAGFMPPMMPGMDMMGGMGGMFIMMQLMQMMQMMMMMMGQRQMGNQMGGGCGCNGGFPMGPQMGNQMGIPGMQFPGMQFPQMPFQMPFPQQGGCGCGCEGGGHMGNYGNPQANPNAQIPNCGPQPNKAQIGNMLDAAAQKYGIPPEILKAVAFKESRWNPNAVGDGGNSFGMMQIYRRAHPNYNVAQGQANPAYNIDYAARLLRSHYDKTGNWQTAVMRYNGSGPMARAYANDVFTNILPNRPWQRQFGVN